MKLVTNQTSVLASILVVGATVFASGCGGAVEPSSNPGPVVEKPHGDSSHDGWWCVEHAIPEEECSMCSAKAAEKFKAKGDWCEEHNRAESQCFICHPENAAKFSKLYVAKFGHEPPKPEGEE